MIIPLMQNDAVHMYHWMTNAQFLNAVALGQITPGPVVATVAAVGYAAHGIGGGVLAAFVAFTPSFSFVLLGGSGSSGCAKTPPRGRSSTARGRRRSARSSGPRSRSPATSARPGSSAVLAAAAIALLLLRRGIVETLLAAGVVGVILAVAGAPVS